MKTYFPVWLDIPLQSSRNTKIADYEIYEMDFMKRRGPLLSDSSLFKVFKRLFPKRQAA